MSGPAAAGVFVAGAAVSLSTSWVLVTRLERIGERLGLSEGLLGMVAALAADAPEITAAITALSRHQHGVGIGVVLGSNVFNLAALLGLGAVVAGRIALHRRVVVLGGSVAIFEALVANLAVLGVLPVVVCLLLGAAALGWYVAVLARARHHGRSLFLPPAATAWLRSAVTQEELELETAIRPPPAGPLDGWLAVGALVVVVAASVVMERAASDLGTTYGISQAVIGGIVLAAVTSLPNAVAAIYLALRQRGAATFSTALNSNALNVVVGLLLPASLLGLGSASSTATLIVAWYAGLTVVVLASAARRSGISRGPGIAIIGAYLAFAVSLAAVAGH